MFIQSSKFHFGSLNTTSCPLCNPDFSGRPAAKPKALPAKDTFSRSSSRISATGKAALSKKRKHSVSDDSGSDSGRGRAHSVDTGLARQKQTRGRSPESDQTKKRVREDSLEKQKRELEKAKTKFETEKFNLKTAQFILDSTHLSAKAAKQMEDIARSNRERLHHDFHACKHSMTIQKMRASAARPLAMQKAPSPKLTPQAVPGTGVPFSDFLTDPNYWE